MKKGLFAKYKGQFYQADVQNDSTIRLISKRPADIRMGFNAKEYPKYYKNNTELPVLYIKDVNKNELEELVKIENKFKYKGYEFDISIEREGKYYIGTTDASIANRLNFERTDKYYYEKWVSSDEGELVEIKQNIN